MDEKGRYQSYLLRLWQERAGDPRQWRASLERPLTGERLGFASLGDLIRFLEDETGCPRLGTEPAVGK
jgi:hypothetical protein